MYASARLNSSPSRSIKVSLARSEPGLFDWLLAQRHDIHRVGYVSGYDVGVLAQHGTHDRGTQLLEKPFLGHELLRFVRRVLDEGKPPK